MLNTILSTRAWALESRYFAQIKPTILKRLQDGDLTAEVITSDKKADKPTPTVHSVAAASNIGAAVAYASFLAAGSKGQANGDGSSDVKVAIIPLMGPMTKNGGMCSYGTRDVRQWLAEALNNPNIGAIVIEGDSPGGSVDGTEDLAADVAAGTKIKPIVGFVNGMAASAAYWVMSQCTEIFINRGTTAWVGSVGTLIAHLDQSQFLEKQGLKVTYITADASVDKVKGNGTQPLDEEAISMFKADLNTINDTFISSVKAGRGERITDQSVWGSAKVFNGNDAKANGMVDTIGSMTDAIVRAAELSKPKSKSSKQSSTNITPMKFAFANYPRLSAFLSKAGFNVSAEAEAPSFEALAVQAESAINAANAAKELAEESLKTANASIVTLTDQVATLEKWKKESKGTEAPEADLNSTVTDAPEKVSSHNAKAIALMERIKKGNQ